MTTPQSVTATGASGVGYNFQTFPIGTEFISSPGLYFFGGPALNRRWQVFYVGQTHNLQDRVGRGLKSHHKYNAALKMGASHVGVMAMDGPESRRLNAESDLIRGLNPNLNDMV
jgi:excinuclease UvrABC nuclease subunit